MITQAMILAAGLGTRLRPLTYILPKPLLPVGGVPLIDRNLKILKKAGVKKVVINLHHLGSLIEQHVGDGKRYGLKVIYSREKKILGTGGGIKRARKFLGSDPFYVLNADVFTNIDLKKVSAEFYKGSGISALMVLRRVKKGEDFARLDVDKNGFLRSFGEGRFMFTGIQILTPAVFKYLRVPGCLIRDGYKKLLDGNHLVKTLIFGGIWDDIGTLMRYKKRQKNRFCVKELTKSSSI